MWANVLEFYSRTETGMDECFPDMRPVRSAKRSSGKQRAPAFLPPHPPPPFCLRQDQEMSGAMTKWTQVLWFVLRVPAQIQASRELRYPSPRGPSAPGRHWSRGSNVNTEGMFWSNNGILSIESEKRSCRVGVDRLWRGDGGVVSPQRDFTTTFFSSYNEHCSAK